MVRMSDDSLLYRRKKVKIDKNMQKIISLNAKKLHFINAKKGWRLQIFGNCAIKSPCDRLFYIR